MENLEKKISNDSRNPPKIGSTIYVDSAFFLGHGLDDFCGGKAHVSNVESGISAGKQCYFVEVAEHPGTKYNWEYLSEKQCELKKMYRNQVAHACPDDSPEFNDWYADSHGVSINFRTGEKRTW